MRPRRQCQAIASGTDWPSSFSGEVAGSDARRSRPFLCDQAPPPASHASGAPYHCECRGSLPQSSLSGAGVKVVVLLRRLMACAAELAFGAETRFSSAGARDGSGGTSLTSADEAALAGVAAGDMPGSVFAA